jgi:transcriptional regulator with XRE-family HTH domain
MKAQALVARNIRRLRVGRRLSQETLAVDAGIDRTYVSRLERGRENPTVAILEKLATALDSEMFVERQRLGHCGPAGDPENSPVALEQSLLAQCRSRDHQRRPGCPHGRSLATALWEARFARGLTKSPQVAQ